MIKGRKILVTGGTGHVARPIADHLAKNNEVWCAARFSNPAAKESIEKHGIKTFAWTLGSDDFRGLPQDFDHVIHAAANIFPVVKDYDGSIAANAEGTGLLMAHCQRAKSFLFVSSLIVYKMPDDPRHPCEERTAPLGFHPPNLDTYSIGKVAAEAAVRAAARMFNLPTSIARLGEAACGPDGHGGVIATHFKTMLSGEPIRRQVAKIYNSIIHEDDIVAQVEPLLDAAAVPATVVNWGGDEVVDEDELFAYIERISGVKSTVVIDRVNGYPGYAMGAWSARQAITGPNKVSWKEAVLRTLRANFPAHTFVNVE